MNKPRQGRARVVATCVLTLAVGALGAWTSRPDAGRKIALIIAISDYGTPPNHPDTGEPLRPYRTLNAHNDIPLVQGALEQQGFLSEDIRVLRDAEADADGIREAFRWLIRETEEGDVVVLHYSGHGHRLTNDNPDEDDEVDGYDELLVPYGAADEFYEGYDGALHIRDDELGEVVTRLRERAGPTGNVTVFLDACYSGTGTRGDFELPARGSETPLGPPSRAAADDRAADVDGTGIDHAPATGTRGGDDALASFAVFSAASQRQVAYETWDIDGKTKVGSLSYAIARALPEAAPGTTYRSLFAAITRSLSVNPWPKHQLGCTGVAHHHYDLHHRQAGEPPGSSPFREHAAVDRDGASDPPCPSAGSGDRRYRSARSSPDTPSEPPAFHRTEESEWPNCRYAR